MNKELKAFKKKMREALANYLRSEGCSCCRDVISHPEHMKVLGKLLNVPMYKDKSGYDFGRYVKNA